MRIYIIFLNRFLVLSTAIDYFWTAAFAWSRVTYISPEVYASITVSLLELLEKTEGFVTETLIFEVQCDKKNIIRK